MNLKTVPHRILQGCGVCLPCVLIVGLLVPGCAGKRSDMLTALIKPKQTDTEATAADGTSASDDDSSSLISGANSNLDKSQLSAFTAEEIIEGRPKLRTRVRSWFTRDNAALTGGDPFLDDENASEQQRARDAVEDRKAIASNEGSSGGESLASFQTTETADKEPISDIKPWWETGVAAQDRKANAHSENARVDELLASFPTRQTAEKKPAHDAQPWWEAGSPNAFGASSSTPDRTAASTVAADSPNTTFSGQFDSRLERLRAELHLDDESVGGADSHDASGELTADPFSEQEARPQPAAPSTGSANPKIAAGNAAEQVDPFATASQQSQELPIVVGNGRTPAEQPYPSLMTQPRQSEAGLESAADSIASADSKGPLDARKRVESLMRDAQQDWEAWRLERAYQTAVAAGDLAARENVQFLDDEERPADLARRIAADLEKDADPAQPAHALANNPFHNTDEVESRTADTPFGFDELERLGNPWTADHTAKTGSRAHSAPTAHTGTPQQAEADEPIVASQSSGVSLLPPDDDFPSDAEERDWSGADPRDIRLANHKFQEFSLRGDQQIREQMKGLSAEDNQALLRNVADQKNRVLSSKGIQWPELPAARQPADLSSHSDGPIHVAQAPRFTLADDMAVAAVPDPKGEGGTPASGGSLLGQFWRSQPIWFIGGVVLLIVALRLWPWPKREET